MYVFERYVIMVWIIISFVFGLILVIMSLSKDTSATIGGIFGMVFICLASVAYEYVRDMENPRPTPIDVYRGRTTLEITYKDSVAIDSVVVWKDEFKPKNDD